MIALNIVLDLALLAGWLYVDALAENFWGNPLVLGMVPFTLFMLHRLCREYGLSSAIRAGLALLLVAPYPLGLGVLALDACGVGVPVEALGVALFTVLVFPLAQVAGLVVLNAWIRRRIPGRACLEHVIA